MDPNSKGLCRATVKENTQVFTGPAVFVVSFFPPPLTLFMAKGDSMPALLDGMISKGKKISGWLMYQPKLPNLSISLDSLLQ